MTGNLETVQKETQTTPRQAVIIFSHMQSSLCKLVTPWPKPAHRYIWLTSVVYFLFFKNVQLPTFEIGEISNKTLDLRFLLENQRSSGAFIPTGG